MRLFEIEDRFGNDIAMILRNVLGRADSKHSSLKLPFAAISNMAANIGYGPVDFDSFNKLYDTNSAIQQVVATYDENGVTLGSDKGAEVEKPQDSVTSNSQSVQAAASSANKYK